MTGLEGIMGTLLPFLGVAFGWSDGGTILRAGGEVASDWETRVTKAAGQTQRKKSTASSLPGLSAFLPAPHHPPVLKGCSYQTAFLKQSINSLLH